MAAKKKITVTLENASGAVYQWHAEAVTIQRDGAKVHLEVTGSTEAGDFGIEVPRGGQVEIRP